MSTAAATTFAGRTTVQSRALRHIAETMVAELAGVDRGEVSAELSDARGQLSVDVATTLDRRTARVSGTLIERAAGIGDGLASRLQELADRKVGRVHVRFTGLSGKSAERRVI